MIYKWSIGLYESVDANDAGAELERIEKENGEITNQAVVDAARDDGNILHGLFEWDNNIAGEKWRLTQARNIIAALVVVPDKEKDYDKRAFVNITSNPENPKNSPRYINYETAMMDAELRGILLDNAKQELIRFKSKYKKLTELAKVFAAIEELEGVKG